MMLKTVGDILIILAVAFTVYIASVMIHRLRGVVLRSGYMEMFRYELMVCAAFLVLALDIRFGFLTAAGSVLLRIPGWILRILATGVTVLVLFFSGKVCAGGLVRTDAAAKHVLVLGLALENGEPTPDLLSRLDTAAAYARKHPESVLILTGGNPDASGKTEAAVMHEILRRRGVPEARMLLEDQADTTRANFRNSARMIRPEEPVVLISSSYHMDRAVQIAREAGFTQVLRLPAPSAFLPFASNVLSEAILEINRRIRKR